MEKLNFEQIKGLFEEIADRKSSNFDWQQFLDSDETGRIENDQIFRKRLPTKFQNFADQIGEFETVQKYDYDDETYHIFYVYHFKDHDVYMKVIGYYSSYSGETFQDCFEVKPVTKTITIFEKSK